MINARYTTPLCNLIESGFDIGLKDYPIWDEEHRKVLNDKIIKHYWFREIGSETPGRFKFYLNRTMEEIMPYYVDLYKTKMYEYNPIHNVDYTEEYTIERENERTNTNTSNSSVSGNSKDTVTGSSELSGETNSTEEATNKMRKIEVDTPQGYLGLDNDGESLDYASKVTFDKNQSNSTGNTDTTQSSNTSSEANSESSSESEYSGTNKMEGTQSETYSRHLAGNYGVKTTQEMIREERDLIINIDLMIIKDIADCFMNIY